MSRARPVVGLTCYVEPVTRGPWRDQPSATVPHAYVEKLEQAGALVLVIPPRADGDAAVAHEVLARVDALVVAGGADVDPARYAQDPHPCAQDPRADRDAMELALVVAAADLGVPLLGICRGMQVMAVASGGLLEQHVPDRVGHDEHSPSDGVYGAHPVTTVPGTRLRQLLGEDTEVPSYHHQSVLVHPGYVASAWADDGTLEAMEDPGASFRLAVQWHPEMGQDPRLFDALVSAAREWQAGRH